VKRDVLVGAIIIAVLGAVVFIISDDPDVDSVGWIAFILGAVVAAVVALWIVMTSRGSRL